MTNDFIGKMAGNACALVQFKSEISRLAHGKANGRGLPAGTSRPSAIADGEPKIAADRKLYK